ncbi:hypothetical protein FHS60_001762 [Alloprevotella rava]|uniref:Uncharacterized protein n=1 Tax=Alloprevotella rava TaxID=671218 RepID=A0A7W5XYG8_9BACT|nr:hypothetical protein [Alloprevotella rava]
MRFANSVLQIHIKCYILHILFCNHCNTRFF